MEAIWKLCVALVGVVLTTSCEHSYNRSLGDEACDVTGKAFHYVDAAGTVITILDEDDGYTEFLDGTKIQPKVGRFLLFPSCWTFYHRGFPPKKDKYICTGWIYQNFPKKVFNEIKTLVLDDRLVN